MTEINQVPSDSKNRLLYKWCLRVGANPKSGDSDNILLQKILLAIVASDNPEIIMSQVYHGNFSSPVGNITPEDGQKGALYYQDGLVANLSNIWAWDVGDQVWLQQVQPVKIYRATVTQTGTSAPVATVLQNTFPGTLVWTRNSAGSYNVTLAGAFPVNKVFFRVGQLQVAGDFAFSNPQRVSDNAWQVETIDSGTLADDGLTITPVEILTYP